MEIREASTDAVVATLGTDFIDDYSFTQLVGLRSNTDYYVYYSDAGYYPDEVGLQVLDTSDTIIFDLGFGNGGLVGNSLITFTTPNVIESNIATATINVAPVNDAPSIEAESGDSDKVTLSETESTLSISNTLTIRDAEAGGSPTDLTVNLGLTAGVSFQAGGDGTGGMGGV